MLETMNGYQFPRQKLLSDEMPYSHELLHSLLDVAYTASPPFTGYLKIEGVEPSHHFLFFYSGTPYSAGRYEDGKPVSYSIQELGRHLASSADKVKYIALCETDPVLLKSMLLFLQQEPDVKAPTSLIDLDDIVHQINEAGTNAMIALSMDKKINFFFFRDGNRAFAHYSDLDFERPEGMSIDEELQLYAFHQPGAKVQAFIFRDMVTTKADELNKLDKESLYKLLTVGFLKDRRKKDREIVPMPALEGDSILAKALGQKKRFPNVLIAVESGPHQGDHFTVMLPCIIGRNGCDLILDDHLISRRHAELKLVEDTLVIEDLASTNGTRVNGEKITRKQILPKDLISIGPTKFRVSLI